jgi:hypothetical protein
MEHGRPAWFYGPINAKHEGREYTNCLVFKVLTDEEVLVKRKAAAKERSEKKSTETIGKPLTPGPPTHGHAESNFLSLIGRSGYKVLQNTRGRIRT